MANACGKLDFCFLFCNHFRNIHGHRLQNRDKYKSAHHESSRSESFLIEGGNMSHCKRANALAKGYNEALLLRFPAKFNEKMAFLSSQPIEMNWN